MGCRSWRCLSLRTMTRWCLGQLILVQLRLKIFVWYSTWAALPSHIVIFNVLLMLQDTQHVTFIVKGLAQICHWINKTCVYFITVTEGKRYTFQKGFTALKMILRWGVMTYSAVRGKLNKYMIGLFRYSSVKCILKITKELWMLKEGKQLKNLPHLSSHRMDVKDIQIKGQFLRLASLRFGLQFVFF